MRPHSRRQKFFRIVELAALLIVVGLVGYVGWYVIKVTEGVTRDADVRLQVVRLQVLNGCSIDGLAARVGSQMNGVADDRLEIRVVDTDDMGQRRVKRSFVVSRAEDTKAAEELAGRLGLNPADVVYEPLENNIRQITATLVLGDDYGTLRSLGEQQEK
jgi:hypothetical protein